MPEIIQTKDMSSLNIKFDCGLNDKGKSIIKSRNFSNIKADAAATDLYDVAQKITALQEHDLFSVAKIDKTQLNA
ncbi:DUF1659 domain-containing protein [Romboutsia maritimum]|uniref:DUF1659 domain-containing protein n=1 Tax=Romboutsia maritimum TaxID=2020948 RepID=A0A255I9J0_9FIRM|nr:DUF1659 domain-containing protein [Romboutsia maritimum]RDY22365.1 DUF1659 domain-containing protein [Romboutsia maritimum]